MGSLRMPDHLRSFLSSEEFGRLLEGSPAENAKEVLRIVRSQRPPKVVVVGDFSLRALLGEGVFPDLGIFDRHTKRLPSDFPEVETAIVCNPAGEITDQAIASIRSALSRRRKRRTILFVKGEEDLLALPAILHAPEGSLVMYGMPNRGMMVVTADRETKEKIASVISQFRKRG